MRAILPCVDHGLLTHTFLVLFLATGGLASVRLAAENRPVDPQEASQNRPPAFEASGHRIVLRIADDVFRPLVAQHVNQTSYADKVILGTRVQGPSHTEGDISVQVRSSDAGAAFWLTFEGINRSHTRGVNRSAITEHVSQTNFVTSIPVTFDPQRGFRQGTPSIRATTQLTPIAVSSTVGGLRGRLVRRIAERRVESTNEQARQIAQRDTSRDVVAGFQQTVAKQLTDLNQELEKNEVFMALRESEEPFMVRSGADYVELCFRPSSDGSIGIPPAEQIGRREIELWVHGSVLNGRLPSVLEVYDRMREGVGRLFAVLGKNQAFGLPRLSFADVGFFDWQLADDWIVLGTTSEEVESLVTLAQRFQNLQPSETEVYTSAPVVVPTAASLEQRFYP